MENITESKSKLPVVVSFYAGDDYYYKAADLLRNDCDELGIDHSIDELTVPPNFDWGQICRLKSTFFKDKLKQLSRPILWLDVDSRLRGVPNLLEDARYDFAAFLRNISELDPFKLVHLSRQWSPGVIFINNTKEGLSFANTLADISSSYIGNATDDYFLEEAWKSHRSTISVLPLPPKLMDRDGNNSDAIFIYGNSGNVKDFIGKVDQHANDKLANLKLKFSIETVSKFKENESKKKLLREGWSRDVTDLELMLKAAQSALVIEPSMSEEILNRAAFLHPKKFESRRLLSEIYLKKGDFLKAEACANEMIGSSYDDWKLLGRSKLADIELEQRALLAGLKKKDRISLWWSKGPNPGNFGDILNPYLIEKITGNVPQFAPLGNGLLAIGSIIKFAQKGTTVWGTGCSRRSDYVSSEALYRSVRGPLTRDIVRKSGGWCDTIYGDPALLLPSIYNPPVCKKYKLGYIPHYIHQNEHVESDAHFINILQASYDDIEKFICELKSCEAILSTSLHGIIVANAYGIPARWATFNNSLNQIAGDNMKFEDYFLSVGMPIQIPLDLSITRSISTNEILKNIDRTVHLKINLDSLRNAFPWELLPKNTSSDING